MRIVIVDDEAVTRKWVRKKIEELHVNYHIVGEFANGKQALEFAMHNEMDAIVTDIRMPVMDGLELLEELRKRNVTAYKIILSAYDEFHYARQAMKLGAHEFLLKPEITKEGLQNVLTDAELFLENTRQAVYLQEKGMETAQIQCLTELLMMEEIRTEEDIASAFGAAEVCLQPDRLEILMVSPETKPADRKIAEIVELFLNEERIQGYCFPLDGKNYVIIYNQIMVQDRKHLADKLFKQIQLYAGKYIYGGLSVQGGGFTQLKNLFRQASVAMENRRFFGIPDIQQYEQMAVSQSGAITGWYCDEEIRMIEMLLASGSYEEARAAVDRFFESVKSMHLLPAAYVRALCIEILSGYIRRVRELNLEAEEDKILREAESFFDEYFPTLLSMEEWIDRETDHLTKLLDSGKREEQYGASVRDIVKYVELHYMQKISLDDMAGLVHLNKSYVSVLFKRETGEKFRDFLLRIRLEASAGLLAGSHYSIQEVAEQTGFPDSGYFSRAFKEKYRMTPMEYRRESKKVHKIERKS